MSSDPELDRIDEIGERSPAKQEDVFRRPTGVANVVDVGFLGSDEDVTVRKAQEPIVGPGLGRDAQAKGRSEGTNDVDEVEEAD